MEREHLPDYNWEIEPEYDFADEASLDREMQRALELDGEKLRQLTGEEHGPFVVGADAIATMKTADRNAILRVRGLLTIDGAAFDAVAAGPMSLTKSATESASNFARRVTLAALDAALEHAS